MWNFCRCLRLGQQHLKKRVHCCSFSIPKARDPSDLPESENNTFYHCELPASLAGAIFALPKLPESNTKIPEHQILVSHFREKDGTPSCRYSSASPRPLRSVNLGRRVADRRLPVEGYDEQGAWWRMLIAAGPGVDSFTESRREGGGKEMRFAKGTYLYLYPLEITGATTQLPAKPTCVARTVLLLPKSNWRSSSHQPSTS